MSHESIASTFDAWAADGRGDSMETGHGDVVRQVLERLDVRAGFQILDLGCGTGWATRLLAGRAAGVQAIGVDASTKMIARAEELHSLRIRARYEHGTFEALDFPDDKFDLVFSMEAIYYAPDLARALAEVARVTKPGGQVHLVTDYYVGRPGTETWSAATGLDMHHLDEAAWRAALEAAGLEEVASERVVDTRGAGDAADFQASDCFPDWDAYLAFHDAGSLWVHGRKP